MTIVLLLAVLAATSVIVWRSLYGGAVRPPVTPLPGSRAGWISAAATLVALVWLVAALSASAWASRSFIEQWRGVTAVGVALAEMVALGSGLLALDRTRDRSVAVYLAVGLGVIGTLFLVFHALFIRD